MGCEQANRTMYLITYDFDKEIIDPFSLHLKMRKARRLIYQLKVTITFF